MTTWPMIVPVSAITLPLLAAGFYVSKQVVHWVIALVVAFLIGSGFAREFSVLYIGAALVVLTTSLVALSMASSRARLGVQGTMGESMLVDLRDRLSAQGEVPELPRGWQVELVHRSAGRSTFSGDFLVATRSADGLILEVALIDVSGKGQTAGTRSLLLSGAFSGLMGSVPPPDFLPAANAYLLRQQWPEGFATAVYLVVDLTSGHYEVRSAGHPPAIHFHAGSGRWEALDAKGGLLGFFEKDDYQPVAGTLRHGDAMMLYTDGLVEAPRRDLADGIDKLQGEAERLVARGFRHGAQQLIDAVASSNDDDRALLLLWRT
ncbi:MAG TPA: PP2C family protein-serine/threonine phosphatase [Jiangellaceae bacterium]|nr:PP2C family protein-serine/threonine phosphatase [Jiangellaceae bacterium]